MRFRQSVDGPFLNDNKGLAAPPWTSIRELEYASLQLENGLLNEDESLQWINLLLAPGASLGGARPKATVLDDKGKLWIAKFPSAKDKTNIGAWEMIAYQLALEAGISMSQGIARKFNSENHTFLSSRFDRQGSGRIHFASAMTLLGYIDGTPGVSYLELVEFIMRHGAEMYHDLEELFRRVVFNIGIKNTHDHLRNHGFLLIPKGWILSPAYDVDPVYYVRGLTSNNSKTDISLDFELTCSVAPYFRVKDLDALKVIE